MYIPITKKQYNLISVTWNVIQNSFQASCFSLLYSKEAYDGMIMISLQVQDEWRGMKRLRIWFLTVFIAGVSTSFVSDFENQLRCSKFQAHTQWFWHWWFWTSNNHICKKLFNSSKSAAPPSTPPAGRHDMTWHDIHDTTFMTWRDDDDDTRWVCQNAATLPLCWISHQGGSLLENAMLACHTGAYLTSGYSQNPGVKLLKPGS